MFCRTGLTSKMMETSSKTTTGSAESGVCFVCETSPGAMSAGMVWLPAEYADHRAADDEVDDDDEDGGVDDGLGGRFTHALSTAFCRHAEETAYGGDDESGEEWLGEALDYVAVLEGAVGVVEVGGGVESHEGDADQSAAGDTDCIGDDGEEEEHEDRGVEPGGD